MSLIIVVMTVFRCLKFFIKKCSQNEMSQGIKLGLIVFFKKLIYLHKRRKPNYPLFLQSTSYFITSFHDRCCISSPLLYLIRYSLDCAFIFALKKNFFFCTENFYVQLPNTGTPFLTLKLTSLQQFHSGNFSLIETFLHLTNIYYLKSPIKSQLKATSFMI